MNRPNALKLSFLIRRGITTRVAYTLKQISLAQTGMAPLLFEDEDEFLRTPAMHCIYGEGGIHGIPQLPANSLLFETGTEHQNPEVATLQGVPVLFPALEAGADLGFDYPAALFWLLSRYEEYQPFTPDKHGRFSAQNSFLHKHNLLMTPLTEVWSEGFSEILKEYYPDFVPMEHSYSYIPTIDVDSAWAYRHKPFHRQAGGLLKALFRRQFTEVIHRKLTLLHLRNDPYDTFDRILKLHRLKEHPIWFFLLGQYNNFNKNQNPGNRPYQRLIRRLNAHNKTGIHPSYDSSADPDTLTLEISKLSAITGEPVVRSRQHFLRFRLPETYRLLIANGIKEDYSMGFADAPGFRAGTCRPFAFYDLGTEQETSLTIYPLSLMDGTLREYLSLTPESAEVVIRSVANTIKTYRGTLVTLWHNSSFDENKLWQGWGTVYANLVAACTSFHSSDTSGMMHPVNKLNKTQP